jgi:hypothetical protein
MPTFSRFATLLAVLASSTFAAGPIATVSSSRPFSLDGHAVTMAGITSWPVVDGDELATAKFPAVLYFHDGSSVKLSAASSVRLSGSAEEPKLALTSGSLDYKLVAGSKVVLTNAAIAAQADKLVTAANPAAKKTLIGRLANLVGGVPASSAGAVESAGESANTLTSRLPPVSIFR